MYCTAVPRGSKTFMPFRVSAVGALANSESDRTNRPIPPVVFTSASQVQLAFAKE